MNSEAGEQVAGSRTGTAGEVFRAFLKLGLTAFGGPIAHLGYFRDEFVTRRRWIDEKGYADLVALCQFLPGPASSQVGFAIGLLRAGPLGAAAAWSAFTLPSALLLFLFASGTAAFDNPVADGLLHGLKLCAVAVVAQAVWGMARTLTPDRPRAGIALAALFLVTFGGAFGQILAIALGGLSGLALCRGAVAEPAKSLSFSLPRSFGLGCLIAFFILLFGLPLLAATLDLQGLRLFDSFYRSGALVFGGGHVVLPLLEAEVVQPGWVSQNTFLAGYGLAQAMPGPLFTFSAYLGAAVVPAPNGMLGATIALAGIFLPGFLLLLAALPFWNGLSGNPAAQAAMRGANAAVVGILGAALYDPVWTGAILTPADFALAFAGFLLLTVWKTPPWTVVLVIVAGALILRAV
ncbi:chromate efflux transporter [Neorhizobium alkalisoli]|uniref:Chromate transporter n=1 Tax=Neorhizobium alkalisoli TaxID=528178 RepID=A0A561QRZ3_9HYPH|nr:chromate efflux transporter [Neorhizobium alkalisoli]TWF53161.1 chromate transporter [Neorhizobium alkalisoli]